MSKNGKHCDVGLDQRCRDLDGEIRQKPVTRWSGRCERHTGRTLRRAFAATRGWTLCASVLTGSHYRRS